MIIGIDQNLCYEYGNAYILSNYSNISMITCGSIIHSHNNVIPVDDDGSHSNSNKGLSNSAKYGIIISSIIVGLFLLSVGAYCAYKSYTKSKKDNQDEYRGLTSS